MSKVSRMDRRNLVNGLRRVSLEMKSWKNGFRRGSLEMKGWRMDWGINRIRLGTNFRSDLVMPKALTMALLTQHQ